MNQSAIDFIKAREQCRLTAYLDSGGKPTIGWGATGPRIALGLTWTQQEADDDLAQRVAMVQSEVVAMTASIRPTGQQQAALISFAYNLGVGALRGSHLLQFVLAHNWIAAAKAFLQWDYAAGMELQGLLKRRLEEAALFLEGTA
jgi:lysozyme